MPSQSPLSSTHRIDDSSNDNEIFNLLEVLNARDSRPDNLVQESNPLTKAPWEFHPNTLHEISWKDFESSSQHGGIVSTVDGFWQIVMNGMEVYPANRRRTTLEFYQGQAPHGDKTVWVMHVYSLGQNLSGAISLCIVFDSSSGNQSLAQDDDDSNEDVQDMLLGVIQNENNNQNLQDPFNNFKAPGGNKNVQPKNAAGRQNVVGPDNDARAEDEPNSFLDGAYLELHDLEDEEDIPSSNPPSSSVSSNSTRVSSMNSDECFNADSFLRMLDNPMNPLAPGGNQQNVNYRVNTCTVSLSTRGSHQMPMVLPPSGLIHGDGNSSSGSNSGNPVAETIASASVLMQTEVLHPATPASCTIKESPNRKRSRNEAEKVGGGPSTSQGSAASSSTDAGGKKKSSGIAKLIKMFSCIIPF